MNYYELFTGKYIPPQFVPYAKAEGWYIGTTSKPLPENVYPYLEPVFSINLADWYLKPIIERGTYLRTKCVGEVRTPTIKLRTENFIIVDNFYRNPEEVRLQALSMRRRHLVDQFHAEMSDECSSPEIVNSFSTILQRIVKMDPNRLGGNFKYNMKSDEKLLNRIHHDGSGDWAVVIYLNKEKSLQGKGGTSLYSHKETKIFEYENLKDKREDQKLRAKLFLEGHNESLWSEKFICPLKFNRAFIYKSNIFHRESNFFDNRLIHRFFLCEV